MLLAAGPVIAGTPSSAGTKSADDLFAEGQTLFDAYAPPEIKAQFEFPTRQKWDDFMARLQKTRETGSLAELAAYEPEAKAVLKVLRPLPEYRDYAAWLSDRIEEMEVAKTAQTLPPPPAVPSNPGGGQTPPPETVSVAVPLYDVWVTRLRDHPRPARADEFLPGLKKAFTVEGVPDELVWLAETESTFNPDAVSPAGACGLFQLMPATARALGLSLFPFDTRTDPEKSAHAAAKLLHELHGRFGDWPLALAAYNAGEGRIRRTLKKQDAKTFAEIAAVLPTETRLYVPRVLATLMVRTGVAPDGLGSPVKPVTVD
jgi:membrane-bound lytic murein transglycosylase D